MDSSYDVIENLMRGRTASRMGLRENIWGQTLQRWVTEGYPTDANGKPVDPVMHFDHDWAVVGGGFDYWPIRGHQEVVEDSEEWHVIRNGSGAELKYWKEKAGTPEHLRFNMTSQAIWEEQYRPHLMALDPERLRITSTHNALETRRRQKKWAMFGSLFVFEHMRQSLGDLCMYESFALNPEWIRDYCTVVTDFFITHFRATIAQTGLPDGVRLCEDLGYKGSLFCSPESLQELVFPCYKRIIDFFHSYNVPVVLHSCGNVEKALSMILDVGFDALDPMERAAGCDPVRFAELTKGKLVLVGGFDKRILESGDRSAIRKGVVELLDYMKKNKVPYIFSTDHSVSTNVSYADYQYMVNVYRDNMGY